MVEQQHYCGEHTQIREDLGAIKAGQQAAAAGIELLNTKFDAVCREVFEKINKHIEESPEIRTKVHALDAEFKLYKQERRNEQTNTMWRVSTTSSIIMGLCSMFAAVVIAKWIK